VVALRIILAILLGEPVLVWGAAGTTLSA
jgi:MoxR-like ATPase